MDLVGYLGRGVAEVGLGGIWRVALSWYVSITRKPNPLWPPELGEQILLSEWQAFVAGDPEFRWATAEEIGEGDGWAGPDDAVWQGHRDGAAIWFTWDGGGQIEVKNPDQLTLGKMARVAEALGAKLISEQGELFDDRGVSRGVHELPCEPGDRKPLSVFQGAKTVFHWVVIAMGICMVAMLAYLMVRLWQDGP